MADATEIYTDHPTGEEIADVLASLSTATVGTVNADGSVHLAYVIFLYAGGKLYFETASVTRKARNAARSGRVSMIVQGAASTGRRLMVGVEVTPVNQRSWTGTTMHTETQKQLSIPYDDIWL